MNTEEGIEKIKASDNKVEEEAKDVKPEEKSTGDKEVENGKKRKKDKIDHPVRVSPDQKKIKVTDQVGNIFLQGYIKSPRHPG